MCQSKCNTQCKCQCKVLLCVVIIFGRCSVINWRRKGDFPGVAGPLGHTGERLQVLQVERSRCKAIASHVDTSKANLMHWIRSQKMVQYITITCNPMKSIRRQGNQIQSHELQQECCENSGSMAAMLRGNLFKSE